MKFTRLLTALLVVALLCVGTLLADEPGRALLRSALDAHYSAPEDSLKRVAARFLVENMEGHAYITFDLKDSVGTTVPFDVLSFPTYDSLETAFRILEKQHGTLDFKKRETTYDDSVLTPGFLIQHIDHALKAWKSRPFAAQLSFSDFCNYVLPYRGSNEPLELWRPFFYERYDSLLRSMKNPADPIEAAILINRDLISWFHFDPRFYYHPTDQGLSDMRSTTLGRCEDMTNLTIYAMRANALAVTSDYTPYWANSGNNHAWNSIVSPDGRVIPFMGAEADPGAYQLPNKVAKVYRKMYAIQKGNLAFQGVDSEQLPPYLASKSYVDVTRDYAPVRTITLPVIAPDSVHFAYLCVFNSGEWKAIHWAPITNGTARFTDMGLDVAYLPALYVDKKVVPSGDPFILTVEGEMRSMVADTLSTQTLTLPSTTKVRQVVSTDGFVKSELTPGMTYELKYWNNGWQVVGSATAASEPLRFTDVPVNAMYWLTAQDSDREERIFTYDQDTQQWW